MLNIKTFLLLTVFNRCVDKGCNKYDNKEQYFLSRNHIPQIYELQLTLNPDHNEFSGKLNITFSTEKEASYVRLHASPSRITKFTKLLLNNDNNCNASDINNVTEIVTVSCSAPIKEGKNTLLIHYDGVYGTTGLKNEYYGLFKYSYEASKGSDNYVGTQFQPSYARAAFPCFDEPQFKAEFLITVIYPENYSVSANTKITSQKASSGIVETKFEKTPPIPTYLIAFVVSKFKETTDNSTTPIINIYTRPSQKDHAETAIRYTRNIVDALGSWTGIEYEDLGIAKLDIVAFPHFPSEAMENWGLITFQEDLLLDEGNKTSADDKQTILGLIAHELAHHWFGNYVTLDWWSNTWLNEGFATYFQYLVPDLVDNLDMEMQRQFVPLVLHEAFHADRYEAWPLTNRHADIQTIDEIAGKFDVISYSKGASIVRMTRNIMGEEAFQKGIQLYLKQNAYRNTTPAHLISALQKFYVDETISFDRMMMSWIYQQGYPVVNVSLDKLTNTVTVSQKMFPGIKKENKTDKLWTIPITSATSLKANFDINDIQWLTDEKPLQIPIGNSSWIILNLQQMGYYRVNYDDELWYRIISALKSDDFEKIHVSNRAQLIDDAFSLAKAGNLDYSIALRLASYLTRENEYEPWYAAAKSFKYISRLLEAEGKMDALQNLKVRVLRWINGAFPSDKESNLTSHLQKLTNQVIFDLRCRMDQEECLQESQRILKKFKSSKIVDDHNRRQAALCFGLKTSKTPDEDYKTLLTFYQESHSAIERRVILTSLGCISNSSILTKYLSEIVVENSTVSAADLSVVYYGMISNTIQALDMTLSFLDKHLKEILNRHPGLMETSDIILQSADWIVSDKQFKQLEEIMKKYQDINGMDQIELYKYYQSSEKTSKQIETALEELASFY